MADEEVIALGWQHRLMVRGARLWWRVRRPRTLGVRAIVEDGMGRILLVRHTYIDQWHLPGGGVRKWEATEAAARREVREETGADAAIVRLHGVFHNRSQFKDDQVVVYVARADGNVAPRGDGFEIAEARWFAAEATPDVGPATGRRLAEYRTGATAFGPW
ncbi:NUDIX domain-containing protein [Sphingomonas corticis]|jgi:8-oxo-dGTP pyrophosphatase MutT (NUDIX family)|uniref:NUDIX domain-containing protein n=1 Tax=Sphingomonas corticis TaxID=2722791 RepID=A0ABX1CNL8_9SPHN|nr:NUDIX domain-containing protein [Sphingomonas corticis]NJR79557.1 NUDIX domain-containing protein [Sphingomonas corticis]